MSLQEELIATKSLVKQLSQQLDFAEKLIIRMQKAESKYPKVKYSVKTDKFHLYSIKPNLVEILKEEYWESYHYHEYFYDSDLKEKIFVNVKGNQLTNDYRYGDRTLKIYEYKSKIKKNQINLNKACEDFLKELICRPEIKTLDKTSYNYKLFSDLFNFK